MKKKKEETNFENALTRLSHIVETVEDSETSLDDAINLYKEGLKIAKDCGDILNKHEQAVLLLQKQADETFSLAKFEDCED